MPEFFNVSTPDTAFNALKRLLKPDSLGYEILQTQATLGRVIYDDLFSPEDLPYFQRSTMDGFSVRSADTFGATEGLPVYLEVIGEVLMGEIANNHVNPGQTSKVYTGGMLENGSDAVVMVEHTQSVGEDTIEVVHAVAPGENVIQIGEDIRKSDPILPKGQRIRAQDIGVLLALGITQIKVARQPRVYIISTGDELVSPHIKPKPGQIRDINTYTIYSLVIECGGIPIMSPTIKDDYNAQRSAALTGMDSGDIVVFSAGSSVSSRDLTSDVISKLGDPGVLTHGISIKPGKPTIIGLIDSKPIFGLPGNPVSAMVAFDLVVRPTIQVLSGCSQPFCRPTTTAKLLQNIASAPGREDYVQIKLETIEGELCAKPIFGKSNLIHTLVRSDGILKIPLDRSGFYAGEEITLRLYK